MLDGGDFGFSTLYAHLNQPCTIPDGTKVVRGQHIGFSGDTGSSSGPHLHFGVYKNKTYSGYKGTGEVDPELYL